jgi:hypothetical protein
VGTRSAHIFTYIKDAGISLAKDLSGRIHHQHTQSNDFWIGAATMTNFLTLRGSQTQIRLRTRSPKSKPLMSALPPDRSRKSRPPKKTAPPGPPRKKTQKHSPVLRQGRIPRRSPRSNQPTSLIKRPMPSTGLKNPMQESVPTSRLVPTPRRNRQPSRKSRK